MFFFTVVATAAIAFLFINDSVVAVVTVDFNVFVGVQLKLSLIAIAMLSRVVHFVVINVVAVVVVVVVVVAVVVVVI